jgi:hypothetical protein
MLPVAVFLALTGCASGHIDITTAEGDKVVVDFSRFGTETGFTVTPEGAMQYSSSPSEVAQQNAIAALTKTIDLLVNGGEPVPTSRPQQLDWLPEEG